MFKKSCALIIAMIAWVSLSMEWYAFLQFSWAHHVGILRILNAYLSYFTNLTNLFIALALTISVTGFPRKLHQFFQASNTQAALVVYIVIVAAVYALILEPELPSRHSIHLYANYGLHKVIPVLYCLYWLCFAPKGHTRLKAVLYWLVYPGLYLIYILIRGHIMGQYPYPFLNIVRLGYLSVMRNSGMLALAFIATGLLTVLLDKILALGRLCVR